MRSIRCLVLILTIALSLFLVMSQSVLAQDGAATFKAKCAGCHGAEGQGKVGPALKGTSLGADQIADLLSKGDQARNHLTRKR
jgi:mono/diheme cytochrome c family protein